MMTFTYTATGYDRLRLVMEQHGYPQGWLDDDDREDVLTAWAERTIAMGYEDDFFEASDIDGEDPPEDAVTVLAGMLEALRDSDRNEVVSCASDIAEDYGLALVHASIGSDEFEVQVTVRDADDEDGETAELTSGIIQDMGREIAAALGENGGEDYGVVIFG